MTLYLDSRADYYPNQLTKEKYQSILTKIVEKKGSLYADANGIKLVSLTSKVYESVKGFFGLTNHTNPIYVRSQLFKFVYFGESHGFFKDDTLAILLKNLKDNPNLSEFKDFITLISDHQSQPFSLKKEAAHFEKLQEMMLSFHEKYKDDLKPYFWKKIKDYLCSNTLVSHRDPLFGEAYLHLINKALYHKKRNDRLIATYFLEAFNLKNQKISLDLRISFNQWHEQKPILSNGDFQELMKNLIAAAINNNELDIAKNYLSKIDQYVIKQNNDLNQLQEEIHLLARNFANLMTSLDAIEKKYSDHVLMTEKLAEYYEDKDPVKSRELFKQVAVLYKNDGSLAKAAEITYRIGLSYVKSNEPFKAYESFKASVELDHTNYLYKQSLAQVIDSVWKQHLVNQKFDFELMITLYKEQLALYEEIMRSSETIAQQSQFCAHQVSLKIASYHQTMKHDPSTTYIPFYEKALLYNPFHNATKQSLYQIYLENGKASYNSFSAWTSTLTNNFIPSESRDNGIEFYKKAFNLFPEKSGDHIDVLYRHFKENQNKEDASLLYNLGQNFTRFNDSTKASICYQKAFELNPIDQYAQHLPSESKLDLIL